MWRLFGGSSSSGYKESQTPLKPLRESLKQWKESHPDYDKPCVVLIGTGSMNPVHRMHITMFDVAALYLDKHYGLHTLAAYISPSSERYVNAKLGGDAMSIKDRAEMCRLAAEEHNKATTSDVYPKILVDLWESDQPEFVDFPEVRKRMESVINKEFPKENLVVLYMCGMDLYNKCGLRRMAKVVAIARPPYETSQQKSTAEHNYVADAATDEQIRELVCDCSSSEIRRRHEEGLPLTDLTFPSVIEYLDKKMGWLKKK